MMKAVKLTVIVGILFAYAGTAYGCNGVGMKQCTDEYMAKLRPVMTSLTPTTACRMARDFVGCLQPYLAGCPASIINTLQNGFKVYNRPPLNCKITFEGSGGAAMTTISPGVHGVTRVISMTTSLMAMGQSTCNNPQMLVCANRFSKSLQSISSSSDPHSTACRMAKTYITCLRPYLTSCSASEIAYLNKMFDMYNRSPLNCGLSLIGGSRGGLGLPETRGVTSGYLRIAPLGSVTHSVYNGAGKTFMAVSTLLMGLVMTVISLRLI